MLKTKSEYFICYKIKYQYLNSDSFKGLERMDWISSQGLIKRLTSSDRFTYITSDGEPLGNFQLIQTLTLKKLTVK